MGKEMVEWLHSKGFGQQLDVQVQTSNVPLGSVLQTVFFNIFVSDMYNGTPSL